MNNLTGGNLRVVLPTLALLARTLARQHLNHERRRERMETLNRIIETQTRHAADPDYLQWLYALHLILWSSVYEEDLTHTAVKSVLRHFAEVCDAAYADLTKPKEGV
ncbi:MAG: hypothetical protein IPK17_38580 [Chloroflexi bacterium]|uniref:hypothetical protein n=1 Tax=Candidatus Flexifilum breve TaxID=3140694 RepID=UPI0031371429|nr:hypothetical protein [Chloroflexota bacterium]